MQIMRRVGATAAEGFKKLYHGFDGVFRRGKEVIIAEAKYLGSDEVFSLSHLGSTQHGVQMSRGWIVEVARRLAKKGQEIGNFIRVLAEGFSPNLKKILVITRETGKSSGVSRAVLEIFDEIFEVDLLGNILRQYTR